MRYGRGVRAAALVLRFLLELAALGALLYAGIALVGGFLGVAIGLGLVVLAAVGWGLYVAPRARIAAPTPVRLAVEVAVFAAACAGLVLADRPVLAAVLAGAYLLDRIALRAAGAPAFEPHPGQGGPE